MTDQKHDDGAELPTALQQAARELKRLAPPEGFNDRLSDALMKADQQAWKSRAEPAVEARSRANHWARAHGPWLAIVPGAAGMALMLHLAFGIGTGDGTGTGADEMWQHVQSQEVELLLDDNGHSWVNLDLRTHHHDGQQALVRVDAPHDVKVMPPRDAKHHAAAPVCAAERCVHRFAQPTHQAEPAPIQVGVTQPGRYRISVEHASSGGRVREEFVVHARR